MHLDRTTRRILGSLIEKRYSTPEQYPLTLNALLLACNQRSNRAPEMQLEEFLVEGCLKQLRIDGWITVCERDTGRSVRYAERMVEQLGLSQKEAAVLAELMLRGPQTEQELHRRTERMAVLATFDEAIGILEGLAARGLVVHLPREPGQRIARWKHLLTPPAEEAEEDAEAARHVAPATHLHTYGSTPSPAAPRAPTMSAAAPSSPVRAAPPAPTAAPMPAPTQPVPSTPPAAPTAAPTTVPPSTATPAPPPDLRQELNALRAEVAALRDRVARLEMR